MCSPYGLQAFFILLHGQASWPGDTESVTTIDLARYARSLGKIPEFLKNVIIPEPEIVQDVKLLEHGEEDTDVDRGGRPQRAT